MFEDNLKAIIAVFALGILVGAGIGGGVAYWQLDSRYQFECDQPPRRAAVSDSVTEDGGERTPEERAAVIIADAKEKAANIRANALLQATAVAEQDVIRAADVHDEASDMLAWAREAEIAAHHRAAAIVAAREGQCSLDD